jgi:phenylacetate-CoA ligase
MSLYESVFQNLMYPAWETHVRGRATLRIAEQLERTQWLSPRDLRTLQDEGLRQLIVHAYDNVPFYRRRLQASGLTPNDIVEVKDLPKLQLLSRPQAQSSTRERSSITQPRPVISKATSGSTGVPFRFEYDPTSEHWRNAIKLRSYAWAGCRPGSPTVVYWALPLRAPTRAKQVKVKLDRALKREFYIDCSRRGDTQLRDAAEQIRRVRPTSIVGYAQALGDLARFVLSEPRIRTWEAIPVLTCAERLLPGDRKAIESAFGGSVFDTYGSREVMLIAAECPAHQGMHLTMENLIVELIVREADGGERPARPGEPGEVVVTDLHNFGMPFIRYELGDMAVAHPTNEACSCGRGLARIGSVEGRVTETLKDANGAKVEGIIFNVMMLSLADAVCQFQAVQHKDRSVTLRIVPTRGFDESAKELVRTTFLRHLPGIACSVDLVSEIPISPSGKRHIVIVEQ